MQETNLYTVTIPPITKALKALSGILDKLSTHADGKQQSWQPAGLQADALLQSRLIADQFPFVRQIQIACDNAKGCAARLAEVENPSHEDNEKTVEELKARIDKTIAFIESVKPEQIIGKESIRIGNKYWGDKTLSGYEYANFYLLPNFYFHIATAYSILRKNGVDLGKADYMGDIPLA